VVQEPCQLLQLQLHHSVRALHLLFKLLQLQLHHSVQALHLFRYKLQLFPQHQSPLAGVCLAA
jgi:hypothetical protein